jgi:hypothetical protein
VVVIKNRVTEKKGMTFLSMNYEGWTNLTYFIDSIGAWRWVTSSNQNLPSSQVFPSCSAKVNKHSPL